LKQSFISPRKKRVVGAELKWLLSTFALLLTVMFGSSLFLNTSILTDEEELKTVKSKHLKVTSELQRVDSESKRLQKLEKLREVIYTSNRLKKENVKNFFDLVPDGVTLELVEFRDNTLRLKGVTVSKKQFNNSFQLSLESLSERSTTTFTRLQNGSYHFENISIMEAR
jgi:cell division protein FtsL